ncbi:MAG: type II toxin-antitoxin system YafQ family toxin [Oscillospiraceae bacterium]|jgi:mRNA interferase YafQ|nr:type II toxin-antitoxin system YafQ family toxin [Oscillospiraceae bacterium]
MKYEVIRTSMFKSDYKLAKKRGKDMRRINEAIRILAYGDQLDASYKAHPLKGGYAGYIECHIQPDWLMIYRIRDTTWTSYTSTS